MGVVVAATHLQLDQKVAIKFMLQPGLLQPALVERFAREAKAAVRLKSDHVARVIDVGVLESGSPYMVMEYLEGSDLGDVIERYGAMPIETAVDCVLQACDAVAEAHSLGIVHRDLKPRNLFWTRRNDGRALVKVLDFGISKHKTSGDLSLTRTTEIIGSPNYMSPEQFRGARAADERSDIWALGVILYELLTGHVPFEADAITQLTAMVLSDPPRPIETLRADVPDELARTIGRCLEKNPAARFGSIAQLAAALQSFAPPDVRDLAIRIARIGSGASRAKLGSSPFADAPARGGATSVNWAAKTDTPPSRRGKAIATLAAVACVAGAALAIGLGLRHKPPPSAMIPAPESGAGVTARTAEDAGGASVSITSWAPMPMGPALTLTTSEAIPPAAAPPPAVPRVVPAVVPQAVPRATASPHPAKDRVDARTPAVPAGDDPPRYRTTW
jgi:hypothetical protein